MTLHRGGDWQPQSQANNTNENVSRVIPQEDAIYDYERVPSAWSGFDEQPVIYAYGDSCLSSDENAELGKRAS